MVWEKREGEGKVGIGGWGGGHNRQREAGCGRGGGNSRRGGGGGGQCRQVKVGEKGGGWYMKRESKVCVCVGGIVYKGEKEGGGGGR